VSGFLTWPDGDDVLIRNASVPCCLTDEAAEGEYLARDIRVAGGLIAEIGECIAGDGASVDLQGGIVFPGFVDLHTHLDKGHILKRAGNLDGTHGSAVAAVKADREANWNARDVAARAEFALRCAYAHGTVAIRTHLDSLGAQCDITWPVFRELRDAWAGRIALQGVALVQLDAYGTDVVEHMADVVADAGGFLGGSGALQPDAPALVRRVFDLAVDRNIDIDLHVDECGDPAAHVLRLVAQETLRRGYQGRVTCGHCCNLALQTDDVAMAAIEACARLGITIVTLPSANMYLQDRVAGRTPRWRGVTLAHELKRAGVAVAVATDNCRDAFVPYGDHDTLDSFRFTLRVLHLDHPYGDWGGSISRVPAATMGLSAIGAIGVGHAADLVLTRARSFDELVSRPQADRVVLRAGRPIDTTLPDYAELDYLTKAVPRATNGPSAA